MREIKFRAWDIKNKSYSVPFTLDDIEEAIMLRLEKSEPSDNYIVEQYTGLKDKNGKYGYENDLAKRNWHGNKFIGKLWISPSQGVVIVKEKDCVPVGLDWEIVGNIHENPELLTKDES